MSLVSLEIVEIVSDDNKSNLFHMTHHAFMFVLEASKGRPSPNVLDHIARISG